MRKIGCQAAWILALLLPHSAHSQPATIEEFQRIMAQARDSGLHAAPLGAIVRAVGLEFLGKPYTTGLLDASPEETLVVDLTQFDCVLFVEAVLAMAQGVALEDYRFASFRQRLKALRYRDGNLDGYCSRLHYFSDWIADNQARGHVRDVSMAFGGVPLAKTLNFMSSHRERYPHLAASDSLVQGILATERRLAQLTLYHIPQHRIAQVYGLLQDGDILALTTHIDGLDVVHTGLAFAQADGTFGMLHASTRHGVTIAPDLAAYIQGNRAQIGIMVARPLDSLHGY